MLAVVQKEKGGPSTLLVEEGVDKPTPQEGEILVKVEYSALNRADTLQRKGLYPAPAGVTDILGLECAGTVAELGAGCTKFAVGDRVMCLLSGGGYAQYALSQEGCAIKIPDDLAMETAAAIPETWLTAFQLLHLVGEVQEGDVVLVHAGASGVGTAATQLAVAAGARVISTAGSEAKLDLCRKTGAFLALNYKDEEGFASRLLEATDNKGVNVILDCVGKNHAAQNLQCLAMDSRWVLYGLMSGSDVEAFPLRGLLRKRASLRATTLRTRSNAYKADLVERFAASAMPRFLDGTFKPVISEVCQLYQVAAAHDCMDKSINAGKILLQVPHNA